MNVPFGVSFWLAEVEEVKCVEVHSIDAFGDSFAELSRVTSVHVETVEENYDSFRVGGRLRVVVVKGVLFKTEGGILG